MPATSQRIGRGLQRSDQGLLLLLGDALAATAAAVLALWIWSLTTGFPFGWSFVSERAVWLLAAPLWCFVTGPTRNWHEAQSLARTAGGLVSASAVMLACYVALYFYAPPAALARLPALYFIWEAGLLTAAWRLVYLYVLRRGGFSRRVIIIGSGETAAAAGTLLANEAADTSVIAVVGIDEVPAVVDGRSLLPLSDLDGLLTQGISEVVLALSAPPSPQLSRRLLLAQESGVDVVPFAAEYEQRLRRVPIAHLGPDWVFTSLPEWVRVRDASQVAKRALDLAGAVAGMAVLALLILPISLLILISGGPPVFYRQSRVGRGGRPFELIKFRTMVPGAEAQGAQWAVTDDPRVTPVGRWLRRSRIDELPQLWNVLRNEMSLVGPRPERPEFIERLAAAIPLYRARLIVPPGITGWAQISADYGASVEEQAFKLEHDLYYIKHRSLFFDVWILVRTVGTVLGLGGR